MIRTVVTFTLPGGEAVDALLLHVVGDRRLANLVYCPPDGTVGQYGASYELATGVPYASDAAAPKRGRVSGVGSWKERD